jgi:hypothetical protein
MEKDVGGGHLPDGSPQLLQVRGCGHARRGLGVALNVGVG